MPDSKSQVGPVNHPGAVKIPNESLCFAAGALSNFNPSISPSFLLRAINSELSRDAGADSGKTSSRLLTLDEAATRLQLCTKSVSRLCQRGVLKPVRLSRRVVRIPESQLALLAEGGAGK